MKKKLFTIYLLFNFSYCIAQSVPKIKITYRQTISLDGKGAATIATLTAFNGKSLYQYQFKGEPSTIHGNIGGVKKQEFIDSTEIKHLYYFILNNYTKVTTSSHELVFTKRYLVTDSLKKINWKLIDEKKTIGKIICNKAEGMFRGRSYTAWYSAELALNTGPWKLWGLPGLIVEATDSLNEVHFEAVKIEYLADKTELDMPKTKYETIKWDAYKKKWKQEITKFEKSSKSLAPPGSEIELKMDIDLLEKSIFDK